MNTEAFTQAYNQSRNGANFFVRHPLARSFQFSDGVQECAEAGCYWLLDIAATEIPAVLRRHQEPLGILYARVSESHAKLSLELEDDVPPAWKKSIPWTDLPGGEWVFEIVDEGDRVAMILITEH